MDFRRRHGNAFRIIIGIHHARLPLLDNLLIVRIIQRQRALGAAGQNFAHQPGGQTRQQAVAQNAADQKAAPLARSGNVGAHAAAQHGIGIGHGKAELGRQPRERLHQRHKSVVAKQGAFPIKGVLAHQQQQHHGGEHARQRGQPQTVAGLADCPTHGRLSPLIAIKPQNGLVHRIFAAYPPARVAQKAARLDAQKHKSEPGQQHQRVHTEHAGEHEKEIQPRLLHQRKSAGKAEHQPKHGGGQQKPAKEMAHALERIVQPAVAVYHFGTAVEARFRAARCVAQRFGDRLRVGRKNIAALLQEAHKLGELAVRVEHHENQQAV